MHRMAAKPRSPCKAEHALRAAHALDFVEANDVHQAALQMERSAWEGLEHNECPVFSAVCWNGFVMRVGGEAAESGFEPGRQV